MKIIISESKKITKDYNSSQLGYTVELEVQPNELQTKTQEIEKWIASQFSRRNTESEVKAVFKGAQDSRPPQTASQPPPANIPRENGIKASSNSEWNVISQKQLGFLYFQAKDQGREHDLKNLYKDMGIITTKDKNNMTKEQLREVKSWLGVK